MEDQPIRCVLLCDHLDRGGLEAVLALLAERLPLVEGHEGRTIQTFVICRKAGHQAGLLSARGIPVYVAPGYPGLRVMDVLKEIRPQIVSSHFPPLEMLVAAKSLGVPIVETIHNSYVWLDVEGWRKERQRAAQISSAISVSRLARSYYLHHLPESSAFGPLFAHVIGNGVDPTRIRPVFARDEHHRLKERLGLPKDGFLFVNLARFGSEKNQLGLVQTFLSLAKRRKDAHLLLCGQEGEPGYLRKVQALIKKAGDLGKRIHIHGYVDAISEILGAADASVIDSFFEGWSVFGTESLLSGVPLLHSECGSGSELVGSNSERGILVGNPAGDPLTLEMSKVKEATQLAAQGGRQRNAAFLLTAMERMIEERTSWSMRRQAISEQAGRLFSQEQMLKQYASVLRSVLRTG